MKISDPLGKVYTHTMFKSRRGSSYDMKQDNVGGGGRARRKSTVHSEDEDIDAIVQDDDKSFDEDEEEEDEDDEDDVSGQSDDSLSTKSSRAAIHHHARRRHQDARRRDGGSRSRPISLSRGEERDRGEDAISFASRRSINGRHAGHHRASSSASRMRNNASKTASMRSKRSMGAASSTVPKKFASSDTLIGPSYNLWSSQHSLKRDHRRKFNRSLCGVLLGISIVLVILGILGIIGIAVYLGVVQKIDGNGQDLISLDGSIRVTSDEFTISLLSPDSEAYRRKAQKYSRMISNTYLKSPLRDAFIKTIIDGFSSGSLRVFFKLVFDQQRLPRYVRDDLVESAREIFVQETMMLEGGEFDREDVDIDTINFEKSKIQEQVQFYTPEPYQGTKPPGENKTLWQTLMDRPGNKIVNLKKVPGEQDQEKEVITAEDVGLHNADLLSAMPSEPTLSTRVSTINIIKVPKTSPRPNLYNPNILPSIPDPRRPPIKFDSPSPRPFPSLPIGRSPSNVPVFSSPSPFHHHPSPTPAVGNRRMDDGDHHHGRHHSNQQRLPHPPTGSKLMKAFLEPPGPRQPTVEERIWRPPPFVPSIPAPGQGRANNKVDVSTISPLIDSPTIVVTPKSRPPNVIPVREDQLQGLRPSPQPHIVTYQEPGRRPNVQERRVAPRNEDNGIKTPQQVLRDQLFGDELDQIQSQQQGGGFWHTLHGKPTPAELLVAQETQGGGDRGLWANFQSSQPQSRVIHQNSQKIEGTALKPDSVTVLNTGSSGLQVVERNVASTEGDNLFNVGSSLVVTTTGKEDLIVGDQNFRPTERSDHNILKPKQIPTGTPIPQGPLGPMISTPRPANLAVAQTPNAPQLSQTGDQISHNQPGPGNYRPPLLSTPQPINGDPGSGQQLLKTLMQEKHIQAQLQQHEFEMQQQQQQLILEQQLRDKEYALQEQMIRQRQREIMEEEKRLRQQHLQQQQQHRQQQHRQQEQLTSPSTPIQQQTRQKKVPPKKPGILDVVFGGTIRPKNPLTGTPIPNLLKNPLSGTPIPNLLPRIGQMLLPNNKNKGPKQQQHQQQQQQPQVRRQDTVGGAFLVPSPAEAVEVLQSVQTPLAIFSNLLNAYATIDSKHDITGKIVESASNFFSPDEKNKESSTTTTTSTTTSATTRRTTTTTTTTSSTTTASTRRRFPSRPIPYKAIIVDAMPSRSNVNPDQKLRKKPPSESSFRVTPSYNNFNYNNNNGNNYAAARYGLSNPHYYESNTVTPRTTTDAPAYGPTDFVVETVKLDKNFFHDFFTSKPLLLGTDIVTSTSVEVQHGKKRGRETSEDLPLNLLQSEYEKESRLQQMIRRRKDKMTSTTTAEMTSTTTTTTTRRPWTRPVTTTMSISRQSDVPFETVDNVQKYKRYQIPPEVKVTHQLSAVPKGQQNRRQDQTRSDGGFKLDTYMGGDEFFNTAAAEDDLFGGPRHAAA